MRVLIIIGAVILLVFALMLMRSLERHIDHPRFHVSRPIPADADTSDCEPGKYGDRVLISTIGDPKTFNPFMASETSSTDITRRMFSPLVRLHKISQEIMPALAYKWELSEDNLELTFHMRRNVVWSDGVPVTAYDAEFSYEAVYHPGIKSSQADAMKVNGQPFVGTAVDSFTFKVRTPEQVAPFLQIAGAEDFYVLPKHILKPELDKGTFDSAYNISWPPEKLVTCGPYLLEKFESGVKTVLRRNPIYWRVDRKGNRLPYLERIIFINVRNTETQLLMFQTGELDMLGVRSSDVPMVERNAEKGDYYVQNLGPDMGQSFFWFNMNPGKNKDGEPFVASHKLKWFTDVRWRKAIANAVDRQGIADTVWGGRADVRNGPETVSNKLWYNPNQIYYDFDLDKSSAYLDDMGFIDRDGDGIREDEDGNPVEFTMLTNTGNDMRELTGNIIKDDLAKIGVKMIFNPIEFNTLIVKIDNEFDYECCLLGLTHGDPDPSSGMNVWLSGSHMHLWYPNQKEPATEWEARIDELMYLQMTTLDMEKRKEYYDEVQYIVTDQLPFIYLTTIEIFVAVKNKYHNIRPSIMRHRLLWNVDEIWSDR